MEINGQSAKVYRWRRAVYSIARALLIETFRDVDTTGDAGEKRALRWQARQTITGVMRAGLSPIFAAKSQFCGGILMKVKALQGDTVDLLCQRHYGTTQGVTEIVLAANKRWPIRSSGGRAGGGTAGGKRLGDKGDGAAMELINRPGIGPHTSGRCSSAASA
jgi:hypothetical protein